MFFFPSADVFFFHFVQSSFLFNSILLDLLSSWVLSPHLLLSNSLKCFKLSKDMVLSMRRSPGSQMKKQPKLISCNLEVGYIFRGEPFIWGLSAVPSLSGSGWIIENAFDNPIQTAPATFGHGGERRPHARAHTLLCGESSCCDEIRRAAQ